MFKPLFKFEAKKLLTKLNVIIMTTVLILLAFFCWDGVSDYNIIQENLEPFQKMEREKVSLHIHYTFYGIRGVRLLFIPSPVSVIFNDSAVYDGMTAHVDTGEGLVISNSFKGKDLFSGSGGYMDFSGLVLLIGSFLALLYGYGATRDNGYINLLGVISGVRNPIFSIILVRIILLCSVFLSICFFALLWLLFNGISLFNVYYIVFTLVLLLVIVFFVLLGAAVSSIKLKQVRLITLPACYFLLLLFIPWAAQKMVYIEAKGGIESIYNFEYETFKYVMNFERGSYRQVGTWESGKVAPDNIKLLIDKSMDMVYDRLREKETERLNGIQRRIKACQTIAAFFPTTFYLSLNKEISSKGFQNFISFYRYAFDMKYRFIKFYLERKFNRPLPKSGVEPFITGDEDLFKGNSQLPYNFGLGMAVLIIWLGGLSVLNWFLFDNPLRRFNTHEELKDEADFEPKKNLTTVVITQNDYRYSNFIARLELRSVRFLEVPGWNTLQGDVKVEWIFRLYGLPVPELLQSVSRKSCQELIPDKLAMVISEIIRSLDAELYAFNNFLIGLSDQFVDQYFTGFLKALKKNRKVIYFSNSMTTSQKIADDVTRFTNDRPL